MHNRTCETIINPSVSDISKLPAPPILAALRIINFTSECSVSNFTYYIAALRSSRLGGEAAKQAETLALYVLFEGQLVVIHIFNIKTADAPAPTPVEP